jgi:UDPglucose 6-dehydrogenase
MRIAVLGAGRVGVPTAASLARLGHDVVATDIDERRIEALAEGRVPFHEAGLEDLVREGAEAGRLRFTLPPGGALEGARAAFLCVGTPQGEDGSADLSALDAATDTVSRHAQPPVVVAVKSTVPVGTTERLGDRLPQEGFAVAATPEFLREGKAVDDSLRPFRIIVGSEEPEALAVMREIYAPLIRIGIPWMETDPATAEVAKHACNAFLAMKISYVNALARVCDAAGADVATVTEAMGVDERIGPAYLQAGLGYGGYCLPKDVRAFERAAAGLGYDFVLLREVERLNEEAVDAVVGKIRSALGDLAGRRVALLGLAFKPGTDNVTAAPALALADRLIAAGAAVVGYDPQAAEAARAVMPELELAGDPYEALEGAHCSVLCTEWEELLGLDPDRVVEAMAAPVVVDGRNALDEEALTKAGATYIPTGRRPSGRDPGAARG